MMFVHKKVNNVQEELLSYFFASERVFLYCFSLFPLQATCLRFELLNRDLKKLFNTSSGVEKEEKTNKLDLHDISNVITIGAYIDFLSSDRIHDKLP